MPDISPKDTEQTWIPKCVSYLIKNEGKTQKQALGECFGRWKEHQKKSKGQKKSPLGLMNEFAKNLKNDLTHKQEKDSEVVENK